MFQRYTERTKRVITIAREDAHTRGHDRVGSEHILLGLLNEKEGLAVRVLEDLAVDVEAVRRQIPEVVASADPDVQQRLPFTTPARMVLERASRQSLSLGQHFIATEHLLLGLLCVDGCDGAQLLEGMGVDYDAARAQIVRRSTVAWRCGEGAQEQ